MDLRAALAAATSGLSVIQLQSSVVSANVANASVEGYTAKATVTETAVSGGVAIGVSATGIESYVDENLARSIVEAASANGEASTIATYLETLLNTVGTTDDDGTLSDLVTSLETAVSNLSVTPESDSLKAEVVAAAEALAAELNALSAEIQDLRSQADGAIATAVDEVNAALATIDALNEQIATRTAAGQSTADLEDSRREALETIAATLEVSHFVNGDNEMQIYTAGGMTLLDGSVHELSYDASGHLSEDITYPADLTGIMLDGIDITESITGGEIGALVTLRDETLVAMQAEIDELAAQTIDTVNAVVNQGTAYPAPNSLTGSVTVAGTDALSATGSLRVAVVDADGTADSVTDLDLTTFATVQDLVDAVDAIAGVSASIDGDGHLVISADDPDLGVAVGELDSAVGADGKGASTYFGLNDLFTGESASSISVRSDLADDPSLLATAVLSDDAAAAAGDRVLSSGDGSAMEALAAALSGDVDFDAAGGLGATSKSLTEYAAQIIAELSLQTSLASSEAETRATVLSEAELDLSNQSGVNLDEEAARLAELENHYAAVASVLETLTAMYEVLLDAVS